MIEQVLADKQLWYISTDQCFTSKQLFEHIREKNMFLDHGAANLEIHIDNEEPVDFVTTADFWETTFTTLKPGQKVHINYNKVSEEFDIVEDYPCFRCEGIGTTNFNKDDGYIYNLSYKSAHLYHKDLGSFEIKRIKKYTKIMLYASGKTVCELENKVYTFEEFKELIEQKTKELEDKKQAKLAVSDNLSDRIRVALDKYKDRSYNAGTHRKAVGINFGYVTIYFWVDENRLCLRVRQLNSGDMFTIDLCNPENDPVEKLNEILKSFDDISNILKNKWERPEG